jgi:hypothetical protein
MVKPATLPLEPEPSNVYSIALARTMRAAMQVMQSQEPALPVLPERPPLDLLLSPGNWGFRVWHDGVSL